MKRILVTALLFLVACGETNECRELKRYRKKHEDILEVAKRRAKQATLVAKRLETTKKKYEDLNAELGLDKGEDDISAVLDSRAKKLGVKMTRGVRPVDPVATGGAAGSETLWTYQFESKDLAAAVEMNKQLLASPPMVRFVGLYLDGKKYRLEVIRMIVDEAGMNIPATKLDDRPDPSTVKSEFGFCGAGGLREEIARLEKEILAVKDDAEALTVNLPKAASFDGLWRRATVIRDIELESRRLVDEVLLGAIKAKVPVKAIGVERDIVIAELVGDEKARGRVERYLSEDTISRTKNDPSMQKGFVRITIINRTAENRLEADEKMREAIERRKKQAP